jgi:hypothetical protein
LAFQNNAVLNMVLGDLHMGGLYALDGHPKGLGVFGPMQPRRWLLPTQSRLPCQERILYSQSLLSQGVFALPLGLLHRMAMMNIVQLSL